MATEKLKFVIELYATFWDKKPTAEIQLGGKTYFPCTEIEGTEDNPTKIEFEAECEEDKIHTLTIIRDNKTKGQSVVNENGDLMKDQLLHIKSIEIDEIQLGNLLYTGTYTPTYPEPWATQQKEAGKELPLTWTNVDRMGHNGKWEISFNSPFYMWLLENLY